MKNFFALFLVLLALPCSDARAETLNDAVETAVNSHPAIAAAKDAVEASTQGVREQRSAYFPELAGSATVGRVYGDNATSRGLSVSRGAGYSGLWEGTASLTQRIYDWGETGNKVGAAKARNVAADSVFVGTQETVGLRAAQAYIALLRAGRLKEAAVGHLNDIQDYHAKIKIQVEEGGADESQLNRANDFLLLAKNAATEFEGEFQRALADYVEAVGAAPQSALKRPVLPSAFPHTLDDAIDAAFVAHPQVAAAKAAVIAADRDRRAESTTYLPKLSSQLSYLERDQDDVIGGEAVDARATVKMDWAYSVGGAQHAREDRARALKAQAKAQLDETYRRVERDVRVAWSALDILHQQQQTQNERKSVTASVVETYKTQYEGGSRTLIELMQAQSQAFDAAIAFDNADYGILSATYVLMGAMGGLLPALLDAPVMARTVSVSTNDERTAHD